MLKLAYFLRKIRTSYDKECEIFRALCLYEFEYMGRFSNLHLCTFKCPGISFLKAKLLTGLKSSSNDIGWK